jgi:WD40 repeat protein
MDSLRLELPSGHSDHINTIAYSPNGKYILSSSDDKTAILWDVKTGKLLHKFVGHLQSCLEGSFSSDNQKILTVSSDNQVKIWETITGKLISEFSFESDEFSSVSVNFSANGDEVIIVDHFATYNILIYHIEKKIFTKSYEDVDGFCFNSNHTKLAISNDSIVSLIDIKNDKIMWSVLQDDRMIGNDIEFCPDEKYLLTRSSLKKVSLLNANNGKLIKNFSLSNDYYGDRFSFNPNGKNFITVDKYEITSWSARTGKRIWQYKYLKDEIYFKCFSEDGKYLIAYSKDSSLIVLNGNTGKFIYNLSSIGSEDDSFPTYPKVIANSDNNILVTVNDDFKAKVWSLVSGKYLYEISPKEGNVGSLIFNSSEMQFATVTYDNAYYFDYSVRVWDSRDGKSLHHLKERTQEITSLSLSANNRNILITLGNSAYLIDIASTNRILTLGHRSIDYNELSHVQNVTFSSDESLIMSQLGQFWSANWDSCIHVWNSSNGNLLYTLKGHLDDISVGKFSPNGLNILTASSDTTIRIWSSKDGKPISCLKVHSAWVRSAEYNSDGSLILSSSNNEVLIVDAKNGIVIKEFVSNPSGDRPIINGTTLGKNINCAMYSRDFSQIIVLSERTEFDADRNEIYVYSIDVYDTLANYLYSIESQNQGYLTAKYSPDGKKILVIEKGLGKAYIHDAITGEQLFEISGNIGSFVFGEFNALGDKIVFGDTDGRLMIWNAVDGSNLMALKGHYKEITKAIFSINDKFLISTGDDNKLIVWDLQSGSPIYELINLENNNWMVKLPNSPYFMCSKDAGKFLHFVTPNLKVFGLENLDPIYNRPDIVLKSIGKYFEN